MTGDDQFELDVDTALEALHDAIDSCDGIGVDALIAALGMVASDVLLTTTGDVTEAMTAARRFGLAVVCTVTDIASEAITGALLETRQ